MKNWSAWVISAMRSDPIKERPQMLDIDLNKYICPCCTSPYFKVGSDGHMRFVECLKSHCKHRDWLKPRSPIFPKVSSDDT